MTIPCLIPFRLRRCSQQRRTFRRSVKIGDIKSAEYTPAPPYEEYLSSEGGLYRPLGKGSWRREKMNEEKRKTAGYG